jgi:hypothetical protein
MKRPEVEQQQLLKMRSAGDEQAATTGHRRPAVLCAVKRVELRP